MNGSMLSRKKNLPYNEDTSPGCMTSYPQHALAIVGVGGLGILEQVCLGNVLDMAKFEKQRSSQSYIAIVRSLYKNGIFRAHTLGLWPWGVGMYFTRGVSYSTGSLVLGPHLTPVQTSVFAGAFEGLCTSPWNMARIRIAENHCENKISIAPRRELLDTGLLARTAPVLAAKRSLDWGLRSALWPPLEAALPGEGNEDGRSAAASFLAGTVSTVLTTPVDRMLPVMMQRRPPPLREWWRGQRRAGLASTWMAGGWARALHGGWHTMFIFGGLRWLSPPCAPSYRDE